MPVHHISASALIPAPPQMLYDIIADYRDGHPRILPKPPFVSLEVERGGTGSGTHILVRARTLGRSGEFRSVVSEPEPGRVLVETNDNGFVTTFTVDPRDDGRQAQVTISTAMTVPDGIGGTLQRLFMAPVLRRLFTRELALLAQVAAERR